MSRPLATSLFDRMHAHPLFRRHGRKAVIGVPYVWLLVFFLLPFLIVLKISVSEMEGVAFQDVLTKFQDGVLSLVVKLQPLPLPPRRTRSTSRPTWSSLKYAAVTTVWCLFIGYPFAYFMARAKATRAAGAADAGDAAVLDLLPAARLRLEGAAHARAAGSPTCSSRCTSTTCCSRSASSRRRASS